MEGRRRVVTAGSAWPDVDAALRGAGFGPALHARTAGEALALLGRFQADLLLADAVLPGMDGPALAKAVLALPLWVHPAVVLAAPRGLRVPGAEALPALNAALVEKPAGPEAIAAAYREVLSRPPVLPPGKAARLEAVLDELGVPTHPGRDALAAAATLAWLDGRRQGALKRRLYPEAGRAAGMTPAQAERAMGYAIDAAWRTGAIEAQDRIFGDTVDARRGRPTCGEMIARLADILRWEGR